MSCYIVEFEQHGEDRAAYGEQLLKKLEKRLNIKGLNERRFREFRRLYLVYPQLKEEVLGYVISGSEIRHSLTAEFTAPIRQIASAELINMQKWMIPADKLFNKLTYSNLTLISAIDNPVKRAFYEMETLVKYATAGLDPNIFVQKYMVQLPSEEKIKKFISKEIEY